MARAGGVNSGFPLRLSAVFAEECRDIDVLILSGLRRCPTVLIGITARALGTSPSNGAAKLAAIRKMLGMHQLDPNWSLPSRLQDNPMVWMLQVNGFMVDVRHTPREVQEIAFKKGLIPYIPADRQ